MNISEILETKKDITYLSNMHTMARTEYFYELKNIKDVENLSQIYDFCLKKNIPFLVISGGTNMVFAFDLFPGVIILNNLRGWNYDVDTCILESYGAEKISDIAKNLEYTYGKDIWHRFIGLPGSIAGAVYGNAGCFGLETESNFISCQVFDLESGQMSTFKNQDMKFSYRFSLLKEEKKYFLLSASFDLSRKIEKYHSDIDNIDFRENKQPKGYSCGSFFKNPSKEFSAGYLIEAVGLKGYKIGGAYFSDLHANFLMNNGTGTYRDILDLISLAKREVKEKFDIDLIPEVQIIYADK